MAELSHLLRNSFSVFPKQIVDIVWFKSETLDLETGQATKVQESERVKATHIPEELMIDFVTRIRSKPFEYGGFFEKNQAKFIFGPTAPVAVGRFLITKGKRYEIKEIKDLDFIQLVAAEQNANAKLNNHIKLSVFNDIFLEQTNDVQS